jgi:diguanylate cyclase (GGDEF)-like protein
MAVTDGLTGITNRLGFVTYVDKMFNICKRLNKPATMLYVDLNGFKEINDTFGHGEGDCVLKAFADCLVGSFRGTDAVARIGGDEFAVFLLDARLDAAGEALIRLRAAVEEQNRNSTLGSEIRFSVGKIEFDPARHLSVNDLLAEADADMYKNKTLLRRS